MDVNIVNDKEKIYACWLDFICWLSSDIKHRLLRAAKSPSAIYKMPDRDILEIAGETNLRHIKEARLKTPPQKAWEMIKEKNIKYVYCQENDFPKRLTNIPDPPFGLFYRGLLPDDNLHTVAIVGARKCSDYGKYMAEKFATGFAKNGISVISGMAYGIDGISQRAALEAGAKSYAVLGSGVDVIYPKSNEPLYNDLIMKGGVISEYPPGMDARPSLFPPRNRIISGLSDVVLVIEAREKSGTLITVDMALEQGRDVYAVPGRCSDSLSLGCNKLLRQGAFVATSYQDVIDDMGWEQKNTVKKKAKIDATPNALNVYEVIDVIGLTQDMIMEHLLQRKISITIQQLCQALLELEIKGYVIRENGQYRKLPH